MFSVKSSESVDVIRIFLKTVFLSSDAHPKSSCPNGSPPPPPHTLSYSVYENKPYPKSSSFQSISDAKIWIFALGLKKAKVQGVPLCDHTVSGEDEQLSPRPWRPCVCQQVMIKSRDNEGFHTQARLHPFQSYIKEISCAAVDRAPDSRQKLHGTVARVHRGHCYGKSKMLQVPGWLQGAVGPEITPQVPQSGRRQ